MQGKWSGIESVSVNHKFYGMAYKLVISLAFIVVLFIAGYYVYRFLNEKLKGADSWLGILIYSMLLFAGLGILLAGGLYVLVKVYTFLIAPG
jgi:hypothetical protein